jgi:membrane associated rhomboid family serine protease
LPRYAAYLRDQGKASRAKMIEDYAKDRGLAVWANEFMERDEAFMRELRAGRVVRPDQPEYEKWRPQREKLDALNAGKFTERYLFRSDRPRPITFLSANFLHGGWGHLIGNMIFLALLGFIVEEVLGPVRYLAFYLISGIGATAMVWAVRSSGLGASGAIAGVMGMYSVLFGMQRVNFLFWLFFYFNIRRAPAVVLLPLWLANEILQAVYVKGNVGYSAHIGGLLTGALLAAAHRWTHREDIDLWHQRAHAPQARKAARAKALEEARSHAVKLDLDKALAIYERLLAEDADDREAMLLAYRSARPKPESEAFHRAALRILGLRETDLGSTQLVHETFGEYFRLAKPAARLSSGLTLALARRFCDAGELADAERLALALAAKPEPPPALAPLLLRLAEALDRAGQRSRSEKLLAALHARFAGSDAARLAGRLKGSGAPP